jgi:glucose/mannose-6-phosphate isomerase
MRELDDIEKIREIDRHNMLEKIDRMPEYLVETIKGFRESMPPEDPANIDNAILVGMGTSATSGEVVLNWLADRMKVPTSLIRDSRLPSFANERTMVLAISYSGETQETLEALVNALRRGCKITTISSGGKMKQISEKLRIRHIELEKGHEPRTSFPSMFVASSFALSYLADQEDLRKEIEGASSSLRSLKNRIGWKAASEANPAKQLALDLGGTVPAAYAFHRNSGLARRMKNQLNENSKMPAMFNLLPEACHNEFEAWRRIEPRTLEFSCVFLRPDETEDETIIVEEAKKILTEMDSTSIHEVRGVGSTRVSQLLSIVYFTDYISYYLSILRKIDPTPWGRVQQLKKRILSRTRFEERLNRNLLAGRA